MQTLWALALVAIAPMVAHASTLNPRSEVSFDSGWRFSRGDIADAEKAPFNDSAWQVVDTPHDWAIAGPFDAQALSGGAGGFLPTGIAWYRKHFNLAAEDRNKRIFIELDGVMDKSGVWINGVHLGHRPNGYASFRYELTEQLRFGTGNENANVIAVRTDTADQPASRWYAGSGIYRHVRLITTGDVHVETWGTFVTTPRLDDQGATVRVESSVVNASKLARSAHLEIGIFDPKGKAISEARGTPVALPAGRALTLNGEVDVSDPRRWDITDPSMHRAIVRVVAEDGAVLDQDEVSFGIREARFDAATGFWLNGRNIKLKGAALHADAGAFGMAAPLSFWERRLKGLQALGVNAIRTAHHPFGPEVLDLCDRLGIIVMNEAFDMWTVAKNPYDYHLYFTDWSAIDARDFVRRDRNHPSVVLWSAGNEIHDTPYPVVAKAILDRLLKVFHENDPTRPVTMALFRPNTTGDYKNGLADMLDVVGQNYRENELAAAHAEKPSRKIIGTENGKTRASWVVVRDNPAYAGMFLWTGVDYLGEANRLGWPAIGNPAGLVDRIDNVKPLGLERASWWSEKPVVHIARSLVEPFDSSALPTYTAIAMPAPKGPTALADWTPANLEAHQEKVEVYSNAEEVDLIVNGRSLGRKARNKDDSPRTWDVAFVPGTVQAAAYNEGKRVAQETLRTAGNAARIRLISEQRSLASSFDAIGFVRVEVTDAKGTLVPAAKDLITVKIAGPGVLAAFDNGDNSDHTPFNAPDRKVLGGRALLMLRANGEAGTIKVTASAPGLATATLGLPARPR